MLSSSCELDGHIIILSSSCDSEVYVPQTKILEGGTKDAIRIFDWLFHGSWPKLCTHDLEKCFEKPDFIFCSSFQIFVWEGWSWLRLTHHHHHSIIMWVMMWLWSWVLHEHHHRSRSSCTLFNTAGMWHGWHARVITRSLRRLACTPFNTARTHAL